MAKHRFMVVRLLVTLLAVCQPVVGAAEPALIGVAANAAGLATALTERFHAAGSHRVRLSIAATATLTTQVENGAPLDALLAADRDHPQRLEEAGLVIAGSRFTYAIGRLVLWSPDLAEVATAGLELLDDPGLGHIAIANPRLAPYGAAAAAVLRRGGRWDALQGRLVRGQSVGQAFRLVASGQTPVGLVALAQVLALPVEQRGHRWLVPEDWHDPLVQQAVQLREHPAAAAWLTFLREDPLAHQLLTEHGYRLPESP